MWLWRCHFDFRGSKRGRFTRFSVPLGEKRNCECVMGILPIEEHVFLHLTEELYSSEMFRCFADSDSGFQQPLSPPNDIVLLFFLHFYKRIVDCGLFADKHSTC